ncbi:MAG: YraN family protein [Gaiellales bacterium]
MSSWASISASEYGRLAELAAGWMLRLRGYRVVARNQRVAGREIDIVARRGELLILCEVKARRHHGRGQPAEAVDSRRQRRMRQAAELLAASDPGVRRVRFDVVTVDGLRIRHLPGAFS